MHVCNEEVLLQSCNTYEMKVTFNTLLAFFKVQISCIIAVVDKGERLETSVPALCIFSPFL